MNTPTDNGFLTAALDYAAHGWPVIPLHRATRGKCSCGKADCSSPGKHPRTRNGLKDASTDPATIDKWWRTWPAANVGIVTGAAAGIIVIDIDPRHGGHESLAALETEHGELTPTLEAATGGGGRHLIYRHPGGKLGNRSNVRPGIDVRGDGGYIVAAPSIHASARRYAWPDGGGPDEREPSELPGWLHELLTRPEPAPRPAAPAARNGDALARLMQDAGWYVANAAGATEGGRNTAAFSLAGHLAAFVTDTGEKLTECQIIDLLRPWNHRNTPPLVEAELVATARSGMMNGTPRAAHEVRTAPRLIPHPAARTPKPDEAPELLPFVPFPVDALPEPVGSFVGKAARAIGCDPSFVALPLLAGMASAIGNTRRLQLKRGWTEPAILWAVMVGDSGTLKSPALELALRPIRKRQRDAMKRHAQAMEAYAAELAQYERAMSEWKRAKDASDAPEKQAEPVPDRCYCDDVTIEALAGLLVNQFRGLLAVRDELAGWFGAFDRYAQGKGGGDAAKWLELFGGRPVMVDRKSGNPRTIFIPHAAVSVTGGIQPDTLRRALGTEHKENGLAARLLLTCPPRRPKKWTEADIDPRAEAAIERIFDRLYELQPDTDDDGEPRPRLARMTPAGKAVWIDFYNAHAAEHADLAGELSAVWSKLEGYAARLALVLHFIRWAASDPTLQSPEAVDESSIAAGVKLSRWFGHEARRVYAMLGETDDERDWRRLVELIDRKGGTVTARELQQSSRQYRTADDAEAALAGLVQAGFGRWQDQQPTAKGGRPTRVFRLNEGTGGLRNPHETEETTGFVDVDSVDVAADDAGDGREPA